MLTGTRQLLQMPGMRRRGIDWRRDALQQEADPEARAQLRLGLHVLLRLDRMAGAT